MSFSITNAKGRGDFIPPFDLHTLVDIPVCQDSDIDHHAFRNNFQQWTHLKVRSINHADFNFYRTVINAIISLQTTGYMRGQATSTSWET